MLRIQIHLPEEEMIFLKKVAGNRPGQTVVKALRILEDLREGRTILTTVDGAKIPTTVLFY